MRSSFFITSGENQILNILQCFGLALFVQLVEVVQQGSLGGGIVLPRWCLPHWRGYFCIILNSRLIKELIRQKHPHHSHRYNLLCNRILSRQHSHRPDHRDSLSYIL